MAFARPAVSKTLCSRRASAAGPLTGPSSEPATVSAARSFDAVTAFENSHQRSLDLPIGNIAEILNSEVALYCQPDGNGQPPQVICSWASRPSTSTQCDRAEEGLSAAR